HLRRVRPRADVLGHRHHAHAVLVAAVRDAVHGGAAVAVGQGQGAGDGARAVRVARLEAAGMSALPLARFHVLDLTRARAGPTCVRQLVDWGSITGIPEQGPVRVFIPVADLCCGSLLAQGILVALLEPEISGEGRWVHISLLAAMRSMLDFQASRWLMSGGLAL